MAGQQLTISSAAQNPPFRRLSSHHEPVTPRLRQAILNPHPDFRVKCRAVDLVTLLRRPRRKNAKVQARSFLPGRVLKAIVPGVENGTKKVTGVGDVLAEEDRLASLIADSIAPKLVPSMEVMRWP